MQPLPALNHDRNYVDGQVAAPVVHYHLKRLELQLLLEDTHDLLCTDEELQSLKLCEVRELAHVLVRKDQHMPGEYPPGVHRSEHVLALDEDQGGRYL